VLLFGTEVACFSPLELSHSSATTIGTQSTLMLAPLRSQKAAFSSQYRGCSGLFDSQDERRQSLVCESRRLQRFRYRFRWTSDRGQDTFYGHFQRSRARVTVPQCRDDTYRSIRNAPKVGCEQMFWFNRSLRAFARPKAKIPVRNRLKGGLISIFGRFCRAQLL
jgi:hypothetical protein